MYNYISIIITIYNIMYTILQVRAETEMVRHYKRKTDRGAWSETSLIEAMHAVREDNTSINMAAATYSITEATLRRYLKNNTEVGHTI